MGQGRFLTFDQRWLGLGCRGPCGSLEQEDTVQGSRGQSPFLGRAARNGLPKRSDAQRREFPGAGIRTEAPGGKVARVSSELHALPGGLAGSEVAQNSPSPPFPRPVQTWQRPESKGSPRCVGGAGVCGAAPLPSPPGGGPAGWGARARRTGFSCGPWGPWRAWWPVGLGGAWLRVRGDAPGWARPCRSGRRGDSRLAGKWRGGGLCAHG